MERRLKILTDSWLLFGAGGLEWCTLDYALALSDLGHDVTVMYGKDGAFRSVYENFGVAVFGPFTFRFDIGHPLRSLARFIEPSRLARRLRPDVLWLNRFENIQWARVVASWARCPIVCQLHHMPNQSHESIFRRTVSQYVAVSEFMREAWIKKGVDPERICVIANALPDTHYPPGGVAERAAARRLLGLPDDVFITLCYGRMIEEKGVATLLEAWERLHLGPDKALLLLVGSPPPDEVPAFAEKLTALGASSYRHFPLQEDVVPFLHASDLVVFPSWLEEGFGRVVIEGMKSGRPVVASRIGAVPEILSGEMDRFLFEPKNSVELASKISSLLNWRSVEPGLGAQCANWITDRYSFDDNLRAFERVLRDAVGRSRHGAQRIAHSNGSQ